MKGILRLPILLSLIAGCEGPDTRDDRAAVRARLGEMASPEAEPRPGEFALPQGVALDDGLSEAEAVSIALWNNADFHEALALLGFRRADLVQAGILPNPVLSILFPVSPKQLEFAVKLPIETLLLRPRKVKVAELDLERASALLVAAGLDLVRDAAAAVARLRQARAEADLAAESLRVREEIAAFYEAQLRAGEASEREAALPRVRALEARRERDRLRRSVPVAEEKLRTLLGDFEGKLPLVLTTLAGAEPAGDADLDEKSLLHRAIAARPEARAAEIGIERAGERAGLERLQFLSISAILDANDETQKGMELGPGLEASIPIFDRNQGGRARARAEIEQAARHYLAVRQRISLEVKEALGIYLAVRAELKDLRETILPAREEALRLSRKAHEAGETARLSALEEEERLFRARAEEAKLAGALALSRAQLERSVGLRLGVPREMARATPAEAQ